LEIALALIAVTKAFVVGAALQAVVELRFDDFWRLFWIGSGTYALAATLNAGSQSMGAAVSARWFRRVIAGLHATLLAPGSSLFPALAGGTTGVGSTPPEGSSGEPSGDGDGLGVGSDATMEGSPGAGGDNDGLDQRAVADTDRAGYLLGVALWGARGRVSLLQVCSGLVSAAIAASRLSGLAVLLCVLFALAALAVARCLLQPVPQAVWEVRRREGVLRRVHARARDRCEAVAGLGGEAWEGETADARTASLLAAAHSLVLLEAPARLAALVAGRGGTGIAYAFTAVAAAAAASSASRNGDEEDAGMSLSELYALSSLLVSLNLYVCALPDYLASAAELAGVGARVLRLARESGAAGPAVGSGINGVSGNSASAGDGGGGDSGVSSQRTHQRTNTDSRFDPPAVDAWGVVTSCPAGGLELTRAYPGGLFPREQLSRAATGSDKQGGVDRGNVVLSLSNAMAGHGHTWQGTTASGSMGIALRSARRAGGMVESGQGGEGANATVRHGEWWRVGGRNGSGKTTLLHCIAGLGRLEHGTVDLRGLGGGRIGWLGAAPYVPESTSLAALLTLGTGRSLDMRCDECTGFPRPLPSPPTS